MGHGLRRAEPNRPARTLRPYGDVSLSHKHRSAVNPSSTRFLTVPVIEGMIPAVDAATRTLGDLLYGDKAKTPVSEKDWLELVQCIAAGDQRALHTLYQKTHRIVFTLIVRIVGNRETAEEVTLDVFHEVWRRAATYDAEAGSVVGWIMNQARSRAIDRLRFEQRKKRVNDGVHDSLPVTPPCDPREAFEGQEQGRLLRAALEALTPAERQVIETAFFAELTYYEVAERLQQPLGTVKTRIRSGLAKLRHELSGRLKDL
jgi:RNA polymerase sigma-70 factor (ECF subfamily)